MNKDQRSKLIMISTLVEGESRNVNDGWNEQNHRNGEQNAGQNFHLFAEPQL